MISKNKKQENLHNLSLSASFPETDDKDVLYLQNLQAIDPAKVERFAEDFLTGEAEPHLKSQHIPKNNPMDTGSVFTLVGEHFLEVIAKKNVLVMYYAPWCGHCKKLDPIYKELASKYYELRHSYAYSEWWSEKYFEEGNCNTKLTLRYNVPGSNVLIAKFDATVNDTPLEVTDIIQGYPSLKLYRKSPKNSVHYAGDRNLDTLIDFVDSHSQSDQSEAGREEL